MKDWEKLVVHATASILDTIAVIERNTHQIALVADVAGRLSGTVTDGDIRRAILRGVSLSSPVGEIMRRDCKSVPEGTSRDGIYTELLRSGVRQMPVVTSDGVLIGLSTIDEFVSAQRVNNPVVIMAGGLGKRLRPYTEEIPKPMLRVGSKPMLQTIIELYARFGFYRFYLSVNYKSSVVKNYFGDGSKFGVEITYLEEKERLGTAGSLSLLPSEALDLPAIVTNGDVLTRVDLPALLAFHTAQRNAITVCAREHHVEIPYGVLEVEQDRLHCIREKPRYRYLVNAGVTVLNPEIIRTIPSNTAVDMPDFVNDLTLHGHSVKPFLIEAYWLDVGCPADLERANLEIEKIIEPRSEDAVSYPAPQSRHVVDGRSH